MRLDHALVADTLRLQLQTTHITVDREPLTIKGKGKMQTYFILDKRRH